MFDMCTDTLSGTFAPSVYRAYTVRVILTMIEMFSDPTLLYHKVGG